MAQRRLTRAEEAALWAAPLRGPNPMQRLRAGGPVGRPDEYVPVAGRSDGDQVIPPPRAPATVTVTINTGALVLDGEYRDITQSGKPALPKP